MNGGVDVFLSFRNTVCCLHHIPEILKQFPSSVCKIEHHDFLLIMISPLYSIEIHVAEFIYFIIAVVFILPTVQGNYNHYHKAVVSASLYYILFGQI